MQGYTWHVASFVRLKLMPFFSCSEIDGCTWFSTIAQEKIIKPACENPHKTFIASSRKLGWRLPCLKRNPIWEFLKGWLQEVAHGVLSLTLHFLFFFLPFFLWKFVHGLICYDNLTDSLVTDANPIGLRCFLFEIAVIIYFVILVNWISLLLVDSKMFT